jgi:long-chain acyl-CoA synthetase
MTFKEVSEYSRTLSLGYVKLGMIPEVQAEGKTWRFLGIQSNNRKEWALTHFANMYQSVTSVPLYDTLGVEATRFCCNQTELTTIAGTMNCLKKLAKMKKDEPASDQKMHMIKHFIVLDVAEIA